MDAAGPSGAGGRIASDRQKGEGVQREWMRALPLPMDYFRLLPAELNIDATLGPMETMRTTAAMDTMLIMRPYSVNPWPRSRSLSRARSGLQLSRIQDIAPSGPTCGARAPKGVAPQAKDRRRISDDTACY